MIDENPFFEEGNEESVTVAIVGGRAFWVHENAMWTTDLDDEGMPIREHAKHVETENMNFEDIKLHMSILDNLKGFSKGEMW